MEREEDAGLAVSLAYPALAETPGYKGTLLACDPDSLLTRLLYLLRQVYSIQGEAKCVFLGLSSP